MLISLECEGKIKIRGIGQNLGEGGRDLFHGSIPAEWR